MVCSVIYSSAVQLTTRVNDMKLGKHTIFGRVSDGMNVVKRMGLVSTDSNDR
jgi:cyclophilin family peptidyl-prolyl cis-trans isomerase